MAAKPPRSRRRRATVLPEKPDGGLDKLQLSVRLAERVAQAMEQQLPSLPGEKVPDYGELVRQASVVLARDDGMPDGEAVRTVLDALSRSGLPGGITLPVDRSGREDITTSMLQQVQDAQTQSRLTTRGITADISEKSVASAARELERQQQLDLPVTGPGRELEREEISREMARNIQKER